MVYQECDSQRKAKQHVTNSNATDEVQTLFVVLPYEKGITERTFRVLCNNGVGFKVLNMLRTCFMRPKDKLTTFQSRCVVYKVNCLDYEFVYYDQIDRALATRT